MNHFNHYIVICEYCCDGESGVDVIAVMHTRANALGVYQIELIKGKQNAENRNYDCIEEMETSFEAWEDGEYLFNHIRLYIQGV